MLLESIGLLGIKFQLHSQKLQLGGAFVQNWPFQQNTGPFNKIVVSLDFSNKSKYWGQYICMSIWDGVFPHLEGPAIDIRLATVMAAFWLLYMPCIYQYYKL